MFAAPPTVETRVFATLPETLRVRGSRTTDFARQVLKHLGSCDSFLEGPSFDRHGNLYCVDIAFGRVFRIDAQGIFSVVAEYEGEPNGLKIHPDGRLFVADRRHGILSVDPLNGEIRHLLSRFELESFQGPNDLVFAPNGDLYFTDQGMSDLLNPTGRVFRLAADGRLHVLLDKLPSPNGIAVDASGRSLYVALTRANSILRVSLFPDGRAMRAANYIQLSGGGGPDGIATDVEGGLAIAHPLMGAVWLFDSKGQPVLRVNLSSGLLGTNIAYGGPDGRRLYITESQTATIHVADVPVRGTTMYSHSEAANGGV